jgi:hypothetical protein
MEGVKRGPLPYATTSLFPPLVIMIMNTTTRFLFKFCDYAKVALVHMKVSIKS